MGLNLLPGNVFFVPKQMIPHAISPERSRILFALENLGRRGSAAFPAETERRA
jgi:hypothetical protein